MESEIKMKDETEKKWTAEKILMIISLAGYTLWLILDTIRVLKYNREEIPGNLQFWAVYFIWEVLCEGSLIFLTFIFSKNKKAKVALAIGPAILIAAYLAVEVTAIIKSVCSGETELNIIGETYLLASVLALASVVITIVKFVKAKKQAKSESSAE